GGSARGSGPRRLAALLHIVQRGGPRRRSPTRASGGRGRGRRGGGRGSRSIGSREVEPAAEPRAVETRGEDARRIEREVDVDVRRGVAHRDGRAGSLIAEAFPRRATGTEDALPHLIGAAEPIVGGDEIAGVAERLRVVAALVRDRRADERGLA